MAKVVKCPTCGTQIEVPAVPTGQIVKCPGCGKGLKLVAKKPAGPGGQPPGAGALSGAGKEGSRGSASPGSMGGSVTAMSFQGEPPPIDDLANLEACDVCGRPTDFNKLVEDNGKMVCPDCIKGARSKVARAADVGTVGFKAPQQYRPTKRGKIVNVTPGLIGACVAAIIWGGCQIWLSSHPKPQGSAMGSLTGPKKPKPGALATTGPAATQFSATPETTQPAEVAIVPPPATAPVEPPVEPATKPTEVAIVPPPTPSTPDPGSRVFPQEPPDKAGGPVPSPDELAKLDPFFVRGFEGLRAKDYVGAAKAFDDARRKFVVGRIVANTQFTPEQSLSLAGLVAANLGAGKAEAAASQITLLLDHHEFSRSIALNAAAVTSLKASKVADFKAAADAIKRYIDSAPAEDEYAADVYGTMLAKWSALPGADRAPLVEYWSSYDAFCERMAASPAGSAHAGQLKWGVDWLPADEVKANRPSRMVNASITPQKAATNLQAAQRKQALAQKALEAIKLKQAQGLATADLVNRAQLDLEAADRAVDTAKQEFAALGSTAKPPKWLEKFEPAIPVITPH